MNFFQLFLPIGTVIYLMFVFVQRSLLLWKRTGVNPFVFGKTDKAHDYIGFTYKFLVVSIWVSISIFSFAPHLYPFLMPIGYLEWIEVQWVGVFLLLVSFIWTSVAQYQMSVSWRIGINYGEKTELVTGGLFGISRNPVFLGILLSYLGTFMIMPNALIFMVLVVIYVTIQIQVRLEEEYLYSVHEAEFGSYANRVRRWI